MAVKEQIILEGVDKTSAAFRGVRNNLKGVEQSSKSLGNSFSSLQKTLVGIGAALATGGFARGVIATRARFEDLRTSLTSVTGSAEAGGKAFDFITKFATRTQFSVEDLSTAFIKLKASGIEPSEELLTLFTDTAAITTDQIGSLEAVTDLFARTVGGGLGLEEIERLGDRGVPVLRILKQELGLAREDISEFGKSAEGARKLTEAFARGIRKEFGGATENLLGNLNVQFSNLGIAFRTAQDQIGGGLSPALKDVTKSLTEALETNEKLFVSIGEALGSAITGTAKAVGFLADNFAILKALGIGVLVAKATTGFIRLAAAIRATGIAAIAAGRAMGKAGFLGIILGVVAAVAELSGALDFLADKFKAPLDPVDTLLDGIMRINKEFAKLEDTRAVGFQTLQDEARPIINDLEKAIFDLNEELLKFTLDRRPLHPIDDKERYDELSASIEKTKTRIQELEEAVASYDEARGNVPLHDLGHIKAHQILAQEQFLFEELAEKSIKKYGDSLEHLGKTQVFDKILSETEKLKIAFDKQVLLFEAAADKRIISETDANTRIEKARRELEDKMIKITQAAQTEISNIEQDALGDRTRQIEMEFANRKRILERALEDELITKQRFAQLEQALEKKKLEELRKNNEDVQREILIQEEMAKGKTRDEAENLADFEKKSAMEKGAFVIGEGKKTFEALGRFNKQAFQAYKAFAIAEAIVSTYQGAAKALASFPPPFNFIAAAAVVAAGLANVNTIRSQSYSGRREGGPVQVGRSFVVGEAGPEIFTPNMNGQITPNSALGGNVNITFEVGAIDSQDLQARLADNRDVIVSIVNEAVNQQGRRSII
jgi:hypothetical protein